jgi:hypothetical protein
VFATSVSSLVGWICSETSVGPIPGIVNRGIGSYGVFCGRARILDSTVKESISIPTGEKKKKKKW